MSTKITGTVPAENIINELYALRAGMSVLNGIADTILMHKEKIREADFDLQKVLSYKAQAQRLLDEQTTSHNQLVLDRETIIEQSVKENFWGRPGTYFAFLFLFNPITAIFAGIYLAKTKKRLRKEKTEYADKVIQGSADCVDKGKFTLNKSEEAVALAENTKAQVTEAANKYNENIAKIINVYKYTLNKLYGQLLNPTDYKNVDLILYNMLSGRANDIKEALQLIDMQVQGQSTYLLYNSAAEFLSGTISDQSKISKATYRKNMEKLSSELFEQFNIRYSTTQTDDIAQFFGIEQLETALINNRNKNSYDISGMMDMTYKNLLSDNN